MNKKFRTLMLLLVMLLNVNFLFAQAHKITGKVLDGETGTGLPGVTIVEKNTTNGTITDIDGNFTLTVSSPDATVVASFIGYEKQEIAIAKKSSLSITLQAETTNLSEIVVIGYGSQKKKVVTGAIASVKAEEITKTPVTRFEQAMQGKTAGVQVTNTSGQPGESPTIRIRGTGTTKDSRPLYVVDGIPMEDGLDYINPGDIESIDVLKDAASAAIYGARAANGVVLVTTKTGKAGKMNISYSGYKGVQNTSNKLDMLNASEYMMMMNEGARNANMDEPFDLNEIPKYDTDWQEELFTKNAPIQSHEISVMGGAGKSTYYSSLAYFNQQGIIGGEKSQYERISARINSDHQVNKRIHFGNTLSYTHIFSRGIGSNESFNGALSSALNLDPLTPVYETDPEALAQAPYSTEPVIKDAEGRIYGISRRVGAEIVNPLALLAIQTGKYRTDKLVGSLFGDWEIIDGLKFGTNVSLDLAYGIGDSYDMLYFLNGAQNNTDKTRVRKNVDRWDTWKWENTLSYTKQINSHKFSVIAGTSAIKLNYENLTGFNADVPIIDPDHVYINMALDTLWQSGGGASHAAWASTFGRLTYDYKEKYALTAIVRRDGSSRFGPNNRYGVFPSVGFSWVASDESFFPDVPWLNTLKLRTSWGINGNDKIGEYQYISTVDKSRGYIIGNARYIGASPSYIENKDIKWEESEQIDIALDMELFNNRLLATVDYYVKTTWDLLEIVPIPAHVGNASSFANVGSVRNKGVELSLNWRSVVKDFKYNIGLNTAYTQNEMVEIANSEGVLTGTNWAVAGMVTNNKEGMPISYFYGYKTDGIFQNVSDVYRHTNSEGGYLQPNAKPGDVRFVDVNGDGIISPLDRTFIGSPHPDWTFGLNANAEYKSFDFSMFWYGTYGNEIFNGSQRPDLRYLNLTTDALDRWTGEGTSDVNPRFTWADNNNNARVSDLYIEDGSYLRLKNIQLGYTLPKRILDKVNATTFRVFVSAENLLTFTKYTGLDPEIGARGSFDIAIDRGIYPQPKTFRVGTTITF